MRERRDVHPFAERREAPGERERGDQQHGHAEDEKPRGQRAMAVVGHEFADEPVGFDRLLGVEPRADRHERVELRRDGRVERAQRAARLRAQPVERGVRPLAARECIGHGRGRRAEMFGQQPLAQRGDRGADARLAGRDERDTAFGVEQHRTVVEIRAADHEAFVVGDRELAVDVHARVAGSSTCGYSRR